MIPVWLDSAEENRTEELALHAHSVSPRNWNGFVVPRATESEFRRFLNAWQRNDPNGDWDSSRLETNTAGRLVLNGDDGYVADSWNPVGSESSSGETLYELDGWCWTR